MVRARAYAASLCLLAGLGLALVSCSGTGNPGEDPPDHSFGFPSGLMLDPRVSSEPGAACSTTVDCGANERCTSAGVCRAEAQWLFVTNANSDRRFNAGSLVPLDLDAFWAVLDRVRDEGDYSQIQPSTASLALDRDEREALDACEPIEPGCRWIPNAPGTIECSEEAFVPCGGVRFGNFAGPPAAWMPEPEAATLLVPVRGDPSVTYIELAGGLDHGGAPTLDCEQDTNTEDSLRCGDEHRLRFLRNDPDSTRLSREPFRVLVSPGDPDDPDSPALAYVTHQGDQDLTIISLEGLQTLELTPEGLPVPEPVLFDEAIASATATLSACLSHDPTRVDDPQACLPVGLRVPFAHAYEGRPAIVDQANVLGIDGGGTGVQGGFGLAERPCTADNAPDSTLGCTRPLVYAAMRWNSELRTLSAVSRAPGPNQLCENPDLPELADISTGAVELTNIPYDDQDGQPASLSSVVVEVPVDGMIECEPQALGLRSVDPGGLPVTSINRPVLADIGFSRTGNELYVVQTNPGALLRVDTSIGDDGEAIDFATGQVEVCSQPTSFTIYDDGTVEYGLVTCYRSGEVYIVDLAQLTVVGLTRAGIGPDSMAVDLAREVVYVANSLDETVSVIDMNTSNATRFTQIARIGAQEAYVQ